MYFPNCSFYYDPQSGYYYDPQFGCYYAAPPEYYYYNQNSGGNSPITQHDQLLEPVNPGNNHSYSNRKVRQNHFKKNKTQKKETSKSDYLELKITTFIQSLNYQKSTSVVFWDDQLAKADKLDKELNAAIAADIKTKEKLTPLINQIRSQIPSLKTTIEKMRALRKDFEKIKHHKWLSSSLPKPLEELQEWEHHKIIQLPPLKVLPKSAVESTKLVSKKMENLQLKITPKIDPDKEDSPFPFRLKEKHEVTKKTAQPHFFNHRKPIETLAPYAKFLIDLDNKTASQEHMLLKMKFFAATCSFIENQKERLREIRFPPKIEENLFDALKCYAPRFTTSKAANSSHISWIPKICIQIYDQETKKWATKRISKAVIKMDGNDFSLNKILNLAQIAAIEVNSICSLLEFRYRPYIYELFENIRTGAMSAETAVESLRDEMKEFLKLIEQAYRENDPKILMSVPIGKTYKTANLFIEVILDLQNNYSSEQILDCCRGMLEALNQKIEK